VKSFIVILITALYLAPAGSKKYSKLYYDDGSMQAEGWMQDAKKVDYWVFYYKNGKVKERGHFVSNLKDKYWYFYNNKGVLQSEGHYLRGQKNNWWSFYNSTGQIIHKCQLKDGIKNGYCLHFEDNEIVKASKYSNGRKQDEWTDYSLFTRDNNLLDLK